MYQSATPKLATRFAWLTPLDGHNNSNGPWLLTENDPLIVEQNRHMDNVKISVKALLDLMMGVLDVDSPNTHIKMEDNWTSRCGHYTVRWHRQQSCTSRLFIQQRSDYFARIELYLDKQLLTAFQEPVWPHLQRSNPAPVEMLVIPQACIEALQRGVDTDSALNRLPEHSANQAFNSSDDGSVAA